MVFPSLWVSFPVFLKVNSRLRTPGTKVGKIPFSRLLAVVGKSKFDDFLYILPLALKAMQFCIPILGTSNGQHLSTCLLKRSTYWHRVREGRVG